MKLKTFDDFINESTINESTVADLDKLLQSHDWYYMYSDSDSVYNRGMAEEKKIKDLAAKLGDEGKELYRNSLKKHFPNAKFD